jgi:hypothetical protein
LFARHVLEVLYSPVTALTRIIEKPDVKGPLLIFVFTLVTTLVGQYAIFSKIFFENGTGGYVSLLANDVLYFRGGLVDSLISAPLSFFLKWILLFGALWVSSKMLGHQTGPWKQFLIVVGHLFVVGVVYLILIAVLYSSLPELRLPEEAWSFWNPQASLEEADQAFTSIIAPEIERVWNPTLSSQLLQIVSYLNFPFDVWTVIISAVMIRLLCEIEWKRAALTAILSYIIYFLLRYFLTL